MNYLEMVDKNFLKTLTDTIKRSGGQSNVGGVTVVTPAFKFDVKVSDEIGINLEFFAILQVVGKINHQQHDKVGPNYQGL